MFKLNNKKGVSNDQESFWNVKIYKFSAPKKLIEETFIN